VLFAIAMLALVPGWDVLGLADPVRLRAGGSYIDVEHGHANPHFADFDGDGKPDLLVGQFEGGQLRVFKNTGTKATPKFDGFSWFQAGGSTGKVPFG
jgi:hypothetical protein